MLPLIGLNLKTDEIFYAFLAWDVMYFQRQSTGKLSQIRQMATFIMFTDIILSFSLLNCVKHYRFLRILSC